MYADGNTCLYNDIQILNDIDKSEAIDNRIELLMWTTRDNEMVSW